MCPFYWTTAELYYDQIENAEKELEQMTEEQARKIISGLTYDEKQKLNALLSVLLQTRQPSQSQKA